MGPENVIAAVLGLDVTSSTASAVYTLNPEIWNSASHVEEYMYKSLGEIWMGSSAAASTLPTRLVARMGVGQGHPEGSIYVINAQLMSPHAVPGNLILPDGPGAETTTIDIAFKRPRNVLLETVEQAELRTRWLIDHNIRQQCRYLSGDLPLLDGSGNPYDKSILSNGNGYFKCFHQGWAYSEENDLIVSRYRVHYMRAFGR